MQLDYGQRQLVQRSIVHAVARERRRAAVETSDLLDQVIAEKNRMRAELAEMQHWFESEIAALRTQLHAAEDKLRTVELLDMFAKMERDCSTTLH